jgi:hypothetical protein
VPIHRASEIKSIWTGNSSFIEPYFFRGANNLLCHTRDPRVESDIAKAYRIEDPDPNIIMPL